MSRALTDLDETTLWYVERMARALRGRFGEGLVSLVLYGSRLAGLTGTIPTSTCSSSPSRFRKTARDDTR